jgi:hypothetical protein
VEQKQKEYVVFQLSNSIEPWSHVSTAQAQDNLEEMPKLKTGLDDGKLEASQPGFDVCSTHLKTWTERMKEVLTKQRGSEG